MTLFWRVLLSAGLCVAFLSLGHAQQNTSALSGTVSGPNGEMVSDATVSAKNEASGRVRKTTAKEGAYTFPDLEPGLYTVTVERTGSPASVTNGVAVGVARRTVLNVRLTGEAGASPNSSLEASSSELGSEIPLPALGVTPLFVLGDLRNGETFVTFLPGVTNGFLESDIAGGLRHGKDVLIDGATAAHPADAGVVSPFPTGGQLSEFRLLTSALPAEYGRTSGGLEIWAARRGFNTPHGEIFEFLRNDALDAAGWAVNSSRGRKSKLRENEYGFQLGGPISLPEIYDGRNRSFFNVAFNDYKQNDVNIPVVLTIPTLAMRNGDFSRLVNSRGQQIPIYDPATQIDRGQGLTRDLFTDNKIPANLFSTVSKNVQSYLPDPSNNGLTSNYLGRIRTALARYAWGVRADQMIGPDQRISFFASLQKSDNNSVGPLPDQLSAGNRSYFRSHLYRVTYETTKRADRTNQLTLGYTRARNYLDRQPDQLLDWAKTLGLTGIDNGGSSSFPVVTFSDGLAPLARYTDLTTRGGQYDRILSLTDAASRLRGKHEMKFGFDFRMARSLQSPLNDVGVQGVFNFANFQTALPSALTTTGNSYASFLLGAVDSATRQYHSLAPDYRNVYIAGYVQDHFRFSPRLTVDVGLRYDLPVNRWDNNNTLSSFDPNVLNPGAGGLKGALVIAGKGTGHTGHKRFGEIDKTEFGPRVGAAYLFGDKTVVRGGYSLLYAYGNGLTTAGCNLCNLGASSVVQQTSNGLNPAFNWDNGLTPQTTFRLPPVLDPSLANGGPVAYIGPNNGKAPRFQNYSIGFERQLPMGVVLNAAFMSNHGDRLSGPLPLNQVNPKNLSLGPLLALPITDPRVAAAGFKPPYAGFTGTLAQALRPYPQYLDVTDPYNAKLHSDYRSLQIQVERRFGSFALQANYTYSRFTSNGASSTVLTNLLPPQDQYNLAPQEGRDIDDIPHVLNLVYSWELPAGRGKRFLGSSRGVMNAVVSGWAVGVQQQYRSGNLLLITAPNTLGPVLFTPRTQPNVTGQPRRTSTDAGSLDPNNPNSRWLNPGAFTPAAPFTFGNAENFYVDVRNPAIRVENFSAVKRTDIREGLHVEYRVDISNLFNRDLFGNINANVGDPNFGRPTAVMIQPRIIQMALRLAF